MLRIIGIDNLARETVADFHVLWFPVREETRAKEFCAWINSWSCDDNGGTHYIIVNEDRKLCKGMEDMV